MHCRYAKLSAEEIRLDRYAKFRKLGQYEEFLVQGGQWRDAREQRAQVRPQHDRSQLASWSQRNRAVSPASHLGLADRDGPLLQPACVQQRQETSQTRPTCRYL